MSGPFYLLGDPWVDRRERGRTTEILYGDDDPHVAVFIGQASCLMECRRCNDEGLPAFVGENVHRQDAEWMVAALNFAVANGFPHPPTTSVLRGRSEHRLGVLHG